MRMNSKKATRRNTSKVSNELIELFGIFLSVELSDEELDVLIASRIPRHKWTGIAEGYRAKWYDYRFISPARSVTLYAHYFVKAYRKYSALYNVGSRGELTNEGVRIWSYSKSVWTAFLKGSQMADQLGIPYDFYIDEGIRDAFGVVTIADAHGRKGKKRICPQANHMYSEERALVISDAWEKKQRISVKLARHSQYCVDMYKGTPIQRDYRDYLVSVAKASLNASLTLYRMIYVDRQISEKFALKTFARRDVMGAKALSLS